MGVPTSKVIELIRKKRGNLASVARALGLSRCAINKRCLENPVLAKVRDEARETELDHAESALYASVRKKEAWAVCFFLKTRGRSRGYSELPEEKPDPNDAFTAFRELPPEKRLQLIEALKLKTLEEMAQQQKLLTNGVNGKH